VKLTPVSGQTNVYDLTRADSPTQEGTPLSKANLLSDETATALGLDTSATVNDAFDLLAKRTIDIAHGGTGATTARDGLANLGVTYGLWKPEFWATSEAIEATYERQNGWFVRIRDVVTLGWDVLASVSCGNTSTPIKIFGALHTPVNSSYGGGECSGYYAPENTIFTGWQIGLAGGIGARAQTNSTSADVHYSSELFYRTSGNVLASGTLTYLTNAVPDTAP
jgi:hypothetical protein